MPFWFYQNLTDDYPQTKKLRKEIFEKNARKQNFLLAGKKRF